MVVIGRLGDAEEIIVPVMHSKCPLVSGLSWAGGVILVAFCESELIFPEWGMGERGGLGTSHPSSLVGIASDSRTSRSEGLVCAVCAGGVVTLK